MVQWAAASICGMRVCHSTGLSIRVASCHQSASKTQGWIMRRANLPFFSLETEDEWHTDTLREVKALNTPTPIRWSIQAVCPPATLLAQWFGRAAPMRCKSAGRIASVAVRRAYR
jgi:hypothetical protein